MSAGLRAGYKQTEVGVIPEDWEVGEVRNLIKRMKSGLSRRLQAQDIGIPVLTSANIQSNRLVTSELKYWYLDDPQGANVADYVLNDGDILLCFINSLAQIGKPCIFRDLGRPVIYTTNIFRIVASEECVSEFAFYLFSSTAFQEVLQLVAKPAVNQASFTKPDFFQICVAIPPLPEQRAIAAALSDVDALLDGLDRLITKKQDLKVATMQQLLTGQTRLPGFSGEWEVKRLGALGVFLKGSGVKKDESQSGSLPCIRYGEIYTRHNDYIKEFHSFISAEVAATARLLKRGDLLFAGSGETKAEIGKCVAFVDGFEAYAGGDIVILRPMAVDSLYLGFSLNTPSVNQQKASRGQGDAVVHIGSSALADVTLNLPSMPEQTAIAAVLSDMDTELAALQARRSKTQALKQGMMQELLTGRIRLVETGI